MTLHVAESLLMPVSLVLSLTLGWIGIRRLRRFDAALRHLYETDHERWKKLGGPTGFFWRPNEKVPFFRSIYARDALNLRFPWFSKVDLPKWLRTGPATKPEDSAPIDRHI